jgi:hypothetical protein
MFSWRTRRYLTVFLIFGIFVAGIVFFVVEKVLPEPSCFDNKQNQGEMGLDCGGPCIPCVLKYPKPVEVFWVRIIPVRENVYDVVAFIRNPNAVLSAREFEYEFRLFDEFGEVARRRGSTFIFAQERTHALELNISTSRPPTRAEFKVVDAKWMIREDIAPNIALEKREYKVMKDLGRSQSVVEAVLVNRESVGFREVAVNFLLTDANGNIVGVNRILVDNLMAGERRAIKSIWPQVIQGEVAAIEIEPRVNVFDPTAILKPQ